MEEMSLQELFNEVYLLVSEYVEPHVYGKVDSSK